MWPHVISVPNRMWLMAISSPAPTLSQVLSCGSVSHIMHIPYAPRPTRLLNKHSIICGGSKHRPYPGLFSPWGWEGRGWQLVRRKQRLAKEIVNCWPSVFLFERKKKEFGANIWKSYSTQIARKITFSNPGLALISTWPRWPGASSWCPLSREEEGLSRLPLSPVIPTLPTPGLPYCHPPHVPGSVTNIRVCNPRTNISAQIRKFTGNCK